MTYLKQVPTRIYLIICITLTAFLGSLYATILTPGFIDPEEIMGRDFAIFVTATHIVEEHGYSEVYDLDRQRAAQKIVSRPLTAINGGVLPFNHPPLLLPLFRQIFSPDRQQSFINWMLINLGLLSGCAWLTTAIFKRAGWQPASAVLIVVPLILFAPLHANFYQGQDILFILLGCLLFLFSLQTDRFVLGGLGLALTTLSPHLALAFAIPWFFSHRKRFWPFVAWGALFTLASILLVGIDGVTDYLTMLSETAGANGGTFGVNKRFMYNFSSFAARAWRSIPAEILSLITWGGYLFGIAGLSWLHHKNRDADTRMLMLLFGITITAGLFFAPHLYFHSLLPLWVPLLVLSILLSKGGWQPSQISTGLLLISMLMLPVFYPSLPLRSVGTFIVIFATGTLLAWQYRFSITPEV